MNNRPINISFFLTGIVTAMLSTATANANDAAAADPLTATNAADTVEAVQAMTVEEGDAVLEAEEVSETIRHAEAEKEEPAENEADPWDRFVPPMDPDYDWLQLTSGEWLKGDFKVLYDFTLEFDSDELGLQEFDFADVRRLRTRAMKSVFVEGEDGRRDTSVLRGLLVMDEEQIVLHRREHKVHVPRERVISIAGGKQRERDYWSGMVSVGVNVRSGNTETADTTIQANIKRRTARSRFRADYLANYSESRDEETANNQRINGFHDLFLTSRFFWKTVEAEFYRDPFSNIDGQYSVSTGLGYDIIYTPRTEWTVGAGVGYQELRFVSVQPGEDASSSSPFATAGTRFDYELTGDIDLLYDYSMRVLNEDNGEYTHHMVGTLSFELISDLDLDVSIIWDRIEKPQLDDDGELPDQDDYQLIMSIAYDF